MGERSPAVVPLEGARRRRSRHLWRAAMVASIAALAGGIAVGEVVGGVAAGVCVVAGALGILACAVPLWLSERRYAREIADDENFHRGLLSRAAPRD